MRLCKVKDFFNSWIYSSALYSTFLRKSKEKFREFLWDLHEQKTSQTNPSFPFPVMDASSLHKKACTAQCKHLWWDIWAGCWQWLFLIGQQFRQREACCTAKRAERKTILLSNKQRKDFHSPSNRESLDFSAQLSAAASRERWESCTGINYKRAAWFAGIAKPLQGTDCCWYV